MNYYSIHKGRHIESSLWNDKIYPQVTKEAQFPLHTQSVYGVENLSGCQVRNTDTDTDRSVM
jgi:hypothetical protein